MPPFQGSRPGYGNQVKRSREGDMCFRCGLFGHWASDCKKTPRLDLELPEELRKDFSAHTDTLQISLTGGFLFRDVGLQKLNGVYSVSLDDSFGATWPVDTTGYSFGHWTCIFLLVKIFSTGFWKNDTQVKHTELKILFRKMKNSVIDSKARNTTVKYAYSFKRFVVWSEKYTEIKSVLPANEIYVSLYLQYLMQSAKHYSTIEAACYAIKWAHSLAGFEDPCASDIVKCIVEASKRKSLIGLFRKRTDECKHHAQSF
ncbi:RECQL4 [Mytilus coruscus]|uniref:RECQL4 n=1 Tax=Mytilus coruscus TaxID=42192 RepID=A0A6J8DQS6_MYTCO|nr:RECQL4 [Mytilus coruscus]